MKKVLFSVLLVFVLIVCSLGAAAASPHDHHSSGHIMSPFDGKPQLPGHCILNGHSSDKPCPHMLKGNSGKDSLLIASDCGGSPFKKIPAPAGAKKHEVISGIGELSHPAGSSNFHSFHLNFSNFIALPFYHPPRSI